MREIFGACYWFFIFNKRGRIAKARSIVGPQAGFPAGSGGRIVGGSVVIEAEVSCPAMPPSTPGDSA